MIETIAAFAWLLLWFGGFAVIIAVSLWRFHRPRKDKNKDLTD